MNIRWKNDEDNVKDDAEDNDDADADDYAG